MQRWTPARLAALAVALVLILHLPALIGQGGVKERLPLDGPLFAANDAFDTTTARRTLETLGRALVDPGVAFRSMTIESGGPGYRPLSTALFVVERAVGGDRSPLVAGLVSLLLHLGTTLLTGVLVARLGAPFRARAAAVLLVAVSPLAAGVVDWPAQQAAVLAATLGLAGLVVALRPDGRRVVLAGGLLAAAGLAHELAFGLIPAALCLRGLRKSGGASRAALTLPGLAALALWAVTVLVQDATPTPAALAAPATSDLVFRSVTDGLVGIVVTLMDLCVPGRLRLADGPWSGHLVARLLAATAVWGLAFAVVRHRASLVGRLGLATLLALAPLLFVPYHGGSPAHAAYGYLVLPLFAAWAATGVAAVVSSSEGARRTAAVAVGATLLAASYVGAQVRAGAARTRTGFVTSAQRDLGDGPVASTWRLAEELNGLPREAEPRRARLRELAPLARHAIDAVREGRELVQISERVIVSSWARDPLAATQVSEPLLVFGLYVADAGFAVHDSMRELAAESCAAATAAAPRSAPAWTALSSVRSSNAALRASFDAAVKSLDLAPNSIEVARQFGIAALSLGEPGIALDVLVRVREHALTSGATVDADFDLLLATAYIRDGSRLELVGGRTFHGFERAILLLEPLAADAQRAPVVRRLLHDAYLLYGDLLASEEAVVLSKTAYERAIEVLPSSVAREHLKALETRLADELADARAAYDDAREGLGSMADALIQVAAALCRQGRFDEADQAFEPLVQSQGGMTPTLLYLHAKHRLAWSPAPEDQARAIEELEQALEVEPDLHAARLELAKVLEKSGRYDAAQEAYRTVARRSFDTLMGLEALRHATRLGVWLTQSGAGAATLPPAR